VQHFHLEKQSKLLLRRLRLAVKTASRKDADRVGQGRAATPYAAKPATKPMSLLRAMLRRTIQKPGGSKQERTGGGRLRTQLGDGLLMYHQARPAEQFGYKSACW
jgi:hypothetical protein